MSKQFYEEGDFLALFYPAFHGSGGVLGFRIMGVKNKTFENFRYGPVTTSFVDSSSVKHEVGVIPNKSVTSRYEIANNLPGLSTQQNYSQDIFFHLDWSALYDFLVNYNNNLLSNYLEVPYQQPAASAYGTDFTSTAIGDVSDYGWLPGGEDFRLVMQPSMRIGIRTVNESNMNLRTDLSIKLRIYSAALVASGPLLYDILTKQGDAKYAEFFTIGGTAWKSDYSMFSGYGLTKGTPFPVLDILNAGRGGAQSIINSYLQKKEGVPYLNPNMVMAGAVRGGR